MLGSYIDEDKGWEPFIAERVSELEEGTEVEREGDDDKTEGGVKRVRDLFVGVPILG